MTIIKALKKLFAAQGGDTSAIKGQDIASVISAMAENGGSGSGGSGGGGNAGGSEPLMLYAQYGVRQYAGTDRQNIDGTALTSQELETAFRSNNITIWVVDGQSMYPKGWSKPIDCMPKVANGPCEIFYEVYKYSWNPANDTIQIGKYDTASIIGKDN